MNSNALWKHKVKQPATAFVPPAVPPNIYLQAGDAAAATNWFKVGLVATLNVPDYIGNVNSAATIDSNFGSSTHQLNSHSPLTGTATKFAGAFKVGLWHYVTAFRFGVTANYVIFDLSTGTVQSNNGTATGAVTALGGGWYWCETTFASAATTEIDVQFADTLPHAIPNTSWNTTAAGIAYAGPFAAY